MSYQYPLPSSGTDFIGNFQMPPLIPPELSQQVLDSNLFSQELSQHASGEEGILKRSSLTSIGNQAVTDAAASTDKRRKGYHRTSVACGYCRRRKIRCILAPADLQNRCANCIRLKKECTFYPVDQPPQPVSNGQRIAPSGGGLGHCGLSYPIMAIPPYLSSSDINRLRDDGFAPENRGLLFGARNEFQSIPAAWIQSRPVADASGYRRNTQDPLTSPHPIFPQTLNSTQQQDWTGARDDRNWGVPQSFGHLENLPQVPYQEAFNNQTSPPDAKPYMHSIPSADPNSIAVPGPTIESSHIPDPWQLPPSSAPQPWQSVPQYGYM